MKCYDLLQYTHRDKKRSGNFKEALSERQRKQNMTVNNATESADVFPKPMTISGDYC